jgi:hypothetical protein
MDDEIFSHSAEIARFLNINYDELPCLVLFQDIRNPKHLVVSFKGDDVDQISLKLRSVFSVIHKAVSKKQDPLTALQDKKNDDDVSKVSSKIGNSAVQGVRFIAEKTFETAISAWFKYLFEKPSP